MPSLRVYPDGMVRALKSWMIATAVWGGGAAAIAQANEYPLITPEFGPKHTAQSLLIMDMKTGQVLYEYKADTRRFPASTTKIMTTMLALDYLQPEDVLTAPVDIKKVEGSSMFLQPGERVSVRDLCHAMMLRSANDACVVIANRIGGSVPGFARIATERARTLGATDTVFVTPHGMPEPDHYTTARDLAKISIAAMKYPPFREMVKKQREPISRSLNTGFSVMESRNKYLAEEPRAIGIKTGFTNAAGECYVSAVEQQGTTILTVILKSDKWINDIREVTKWVDTEWQTVTMAQANQVVGRMPMKGGWAGDLPLTVAEDVNVFVPQGPKPALKWNTETPVEAGIKKGDIVAVATLEPTPGHKIEVNLLAAEDAPRKSLIAAIATSPWTYLVGLAGFGGTTLCRNRARKQMRRRRPMATAPLRRPAPAPRPASPAPQRRPSPNRAQAPRDARPTRTTPSSRYRS